MFGRATEHGLSFSLSFPGWFPAKFVQILDERSKEVSIIGSLSTRTFTDWGLSQQGIMYQVRRASNNQACQQDLSARGEGGERGWGWGAFSLPLPSPVPKPVCRLQTTERKLPSGFQRPTYPNSSSLLCLLPVLYSRRRLGLGDRNRPGQRRVGSLWGYEETVVPGGRVPGRRLDFTSC